MKKVLCCGGGRHHGETGDRAPLRPDLKFVTHSQGHEQPVFRLRARRLLAGRGNSAIKCIYKGPATTSRRPKPRSSRVSSPRGWTASRFRWLTPPAISESINPATAAGIPVITFDSDAPGSKRRPNRHRQQGDGRRPRQATAEAPARRRQVRHRVRRPGAQNLAERVDGVREALKGSKGSKSRGRRPSATTTPRSPSSR